MRYEEFSAGKLRLGKEKETITLSSFDTIPADGASGYNPGSLLILPDAVLGMTPMWMNLGTKTSCKFRPVGPQPGYGFYRAGGGIASAGGDTTEVITISDAMSEWDIGIVGHSVSNDTDNIVSAIITDKTLTIVGSADPSTDHAYNYGVLRQGCVPEFDIVFAGTHTCVGGAAAETITLTGALATDIAFVTYGATNDTDTIAKAVMTENTLTVTMSDDPGTAHSLHYMVLRPRGTGSRKPTHYIAYAGLHTTLGGAKAEAVTVTGALATDIPIVGYSVTNDTDTILKAVMTANTLTVTCSADPSTVHGFWYVILRAY